MFYKKIYLPIVICIRNKLLVKKLFWSAYFNLQIASHYQALYRDNLKSSAFNCWYFFQFSGYSTYIYFYSKLVIKKCIKFQKDFIAIIDACEVEKFFQKYSMSHWISLRKKKIPWKYEKRLAAELSSFLGQKYRPKPFNFPVVSLI